MRKNSFAFCGGAFGDEGKGRIVDEFVHRFSKKFQVIVYRDNGGANAGHTVELKEGKRIALHQLPSGVFGKKTTLILGKGMVIHPGDLLEEIRQVKSVGGGSAKIMLDSMASLSLDTHRAYESVLKNWQSGGKGATGRGISPAYADILLRHPLKVRDLQPFNSKKIEEHYSLYQALIKGLGQTLSQVAVPTLGKEGKIKMGNMPEFLRRLKKQAQQISPYIYDVIPFLRKVWPNKKYTFIFEKAQAVGLDPKWGVYPDITASDTTLDGIFSATEGIIDPADIEIRAGVIKATYMSSVGIRELPSVMDEKLAHQIREDGNEYGATTRRPRGIFHLDIPALKFFMHVGKISHLVVTHMDMVYPKTSVKVCTAYIYKGRQIEYRPDQEFLHTVKPKYIALPSWDKEKLMRAKKYAEIPKEAKTFLRFLEKELDVKVVMITTGPQRNQGIYL